MSVRDFSKCPTCKAPTVKAIAFHGGESEFWLECTRCNTFINTYVPMPHQVEVHRDSHRYVGNFGAYGTGKTLTSREELYKHIFITPNGNSLVGANIQPQYEQTIKRDVEADMPVAFVKAYSTQKQYYDIINGHRLMFRPFDDADKLRSLNLSMFVMVEGSEVKSEVFTQLKTRLRNTSATIPKRNKAGEIIYKTIQSTGEKIPKLQADWRRGIIESNPDSGWIRNDVLLKSDVVHKHGDCIDNYSILDEERDPAISSHVASSNCNAYLPEGWIDELCKNKPAWWVSRFVFGSFKYAEGLVYPSAANCTCETFEIPKHWKRIIAFDYGLADNSVFLFGAIDEKNNLLYIYKEIVTNNRSVEDLATLYHEGVRDIPSGGMMCSPIIDPKSAPKRDYEKKTLADHFLDYNIAFQPGYINLDARVYRLNTYFESGRVKIMECCSVLIKELRDYKFKQKPKGDSGWDDKPEDKNNHCINPLEWITMELPADPKNLVHGIYNKHGVNLLEPPKDDRKQFAVHALMDDEQTNDFYKDDNPYGEGSFIFD